MKNKQIILVSCLLSLVSTGCASFATDPSGFQISGITASPESVIRASSDARMASMHSTLEVEERRTRIELGKKCYEDYGPICASLGFGVGYNGLSNGQYSGAFYSPYDYTNLGLLAAGVSKSSMNSDGDATTIAKDAQEKANKSLQEVHDLLEELSKRSN